jgi:DNA-binding transcriptional ArsR family regulator
MSPGSPVPPPNADVLGAIADPTRRLILSRLAEAGEATATTLAPHLDVSRQAVVKHLGVLGEAGLVRSRRQGREVRFRVHPEPLHETAGWLHDLAVGWEVRLQKIKAIAEGEVDR